jgi:hypothetical protein
MAGRPDTRWSKSISIDPWSPSHDLGILQTGVERVAEHLAIAWATIANAPKGRSATPQQEDARRKAAIQLLDAVRPMAAKIVERLDGDVNRWFRTLLEVQPLAEEFADDQIWEMLETSPVDRAMDLLAVPVIQDAIRRFRSGSSATTRNRLRRAFRRLATAPGKAGRPERASSADLSSHLASCDRIKADVLDFRRRWRGDLNEPGVMEDAIVLVRKHVPLAAAGPCLRTAKGLTSAKRPARAVELLVCAAHPNLSLTDVRALLKTAPKRTKESSA